MAETTRLLFVDSKNRDTTLYSTGTSYTLHLTTPIKNVTRVDLVSARVPNTMFNLTDGSNVFALSSSNVSINAGFYSAYDLATAVTDQGSVTLDYLSPEGKFVFSSASSFTIQIGSSDFAKLVGLVQNTLYNSSTATILDPNYSGKDILKSSTMANLNLNEYVFLDIDELKTPWNLDAKAMDNSKGTFLGTNATRMFAPIVMDVSSGCIKNFHENRDYRVCTWYPEPIGTLSRLTINWYDKDGSPLDFRGWDTNAFLLRLYVTEDEGRRLPPPPPLQDVEIRRIVEAMTFRPPEAPKENQKRKIPWWIIVLVILGSILAWRNFSTRELSRTSATGAPSPQRP
jgi:hypothetical protein